MHMMLLPSVWSGRLLTVCNWCWVEWLVHQDFYTIGGLIDTSNGSGVCP